MLTLTHPLQHISGKDHDRHLRRSRSTVSIGGRAITILFFVDDIDGLAGEEEELAKLVERLDKVSTTDSMEISAEKTKPMTNNSGINTEIKVNGQKPETVTSFKYLGSVKYPTDHVHVNPQFRCTKIHCSVACKPTVQVKVSPLFKCK